MAPPGRPKKVVQMEEEEDDHDEMKKNVVRALPFFKLLSYADYVDWILMGLGTLGSIVHGMALPVGYLLLGKALNAFGNNIHDIDAMVPALKKVLNNIHIVHTNKCYIGC